jgi:hypothetical protein
MSTPLTVSIPHRHGKEEALRRIRTGFGSARAQFASVIAFDEEVWSGDTMQFRARALGQTAAGDITVHDDRVVLTVTLPWLLSKFANAVQGAVKKQGALMLEKK